MPTLQTPNLLIKTEYWDRACGAKNITLRDTKNNSIAFGKSTSRRIYPKLHTPKIG